MPKVFISYRRADSAYAAHAIYDKLSEHYGPESVVFDVNATPLGADFVEYLNTKVSQCDALLVIIGDVWLDARSEDGSRRLDDPDDLVRVEIQAALARNIPVVPVLTGQVTMPKKESLPPDMRALIRHNAAEVRAGRNLQSDLDQLVRDLEHMFQGLAEAASKYATPESDSPPTPPADAKSRPAQERRTTPTTVTGKQEHFSIVSSSAKAPGDVVTSSVGIRLKRLPAGEFMMGSPVAERMAYDEERPQHPVRITQPFLLGVYAVTQDEFQRVMGNNPSRCKGDGRQPVECVRWYDAVKFCNALSNRDKIDEFYKISARAVSTQGGLGYRLPTEAEWEYACRAGTTAKWSCGNAEKDLEAVAWFGKNYSDGPLPVGQKNPNLWGLHDMHGNVWEWCFDWYGEYGKAAADDPSGPATGNRRILRGGSFRDTSGECRSAFRYFWPPGDRYDIIGFRVARTNH